MNDGEALLAAIRDEPGEMTLRLAYIDWAKENPEQIREAVAAVAIKMPRLTAFGIGVIRHRGETPEQRRARFDSDRAELLASLEGFAASVAWLAGMGKRQTVDKSRTSYGYKHEVERFFEGTRHQYVTNGEFIAAAVHCGFVIKEVLGSPNVLVGVSRRPLKGKRG